MYARENMLANLVSACVNRTTGRGKLETRGKRKAQKGMKARKEGREKEREREIKDFPLAFDDASRASAGAFRPIFIFLFFFSST